MSIKINGIPISEYNLKCELEHDHPALSDTRDYTISIPGMAGAHDFGADMGPKSFNLPFKFTNVKSNTDIAFEIRRFKKAILDGYGNPKTFELQFDYESSKYYNARYSGSLPLERLIHRGRFVLPLIAFDPFAYSVAMNNEITWGSEVITFDSEYLFGQSNGETHTIIAPKTITETVTGDILRPVFNINGSGTDVTVAANGQTFSLGTFTNANWLVDGDNYTVIRNDANGLQYFSGDWIELINGDNNITISGSGLNLTFECRFRDKYM
ncbi:phage tail domain-containing protein [Metabacillus bambusae]|uniref:Phage tail family protein n=1 Tax=Metabacillus bambusae TaxID=2795218 RepID=A0ABS3NBF2_9BACI|nr:phage tail domain-containing protein [Metabacillus bambusae]MBO1515609.1 phage tail family protein [Metabacillus bambusae]